MTPAQKRDFLRMHTALRTIAKGFKTPAQIAREAESNTVLSNLEYLEMAYENIQDTARAGVKGVRLPK